MKNIEEEILRQLEEIEEKEQVCVLYAAESGSRAWGVASPDSDYDVRFVYVRRENDYLKLQNTRDVIEWRLDAVLDINGWDLKKTLQQFHRGNATLFEWCNSPVVYKSTEEWKKLSGVAAGYFSVRTAMHHYYGMAKRTWEEYLTGDSVRYKKYVYALRPVLACRYIEKNHDAPPVLFKDLMRSVELSAGTKIAIAEMLAIKERTDEKDSFPQIPEIKNFIADELVQISKISQGIPDDRKEDWEPLNDIFREIVQRCAARRSM